MMTYNIAVAARCVEVGQRARRVIARCYGLARSRPLCLCARAAVAGGIGRYTALVMIHQSLDTPYGEATAAASITYDFTQASGVGIAGRARAGRARLLSLAGS